jgi:outer membrane protein TolC
MIKKSIKNLPLSSLMLLILITSGCAVTRSAVPDTVPDVPASFSTAGIVQGPPVGRWWEQFEDLRLNILMNEAFRYNLDIAKAYERYLQSMANVSITGSSKWVNFNVEGSGGRARMAGVEADTYSLSASASYELDLWKKAGSRTEASRLDAFASKEDLKAAYISISAQLADLYYLAVEQRLQMELSDRIITSFQDTLNRVERRYSEGLVPAIDVYQSRQGLAGAKAQRPVFESTLAVTVNSLSVLLGRFPGKDIKGEIKELKDIGAFETGLPSQLLTRRPDIRAALLRVITPYTMERAFTGCPARD